MGSTAAVEPGLAATGGMNAEAVAVTAGGFSVAGAAALWPGEECFGVVGGVPAADAGGVPPLPLGAAAGEVVSVCAMSFIADAVRALRQARLER